MSPLRTHALRRRGTVLLLASALLWAVPAAPDIESSRVALEYELKAVFIGKLISFVEWPSEVFESRDEPLVIAVLGDDPFGEALDLAVAETRVSGRSVVVERAPSLKQLGHPHVLFVSDSERERLCDVLGAIDGRPILSVSDFRGFSSHGGVLTLEMRRQRVRLSVNASAYRRSGLTISAKLLQISREVPEEPCR